MRVNVVALVFLVIFVLLTVGTGYLAYANFTKVARAPGEGAVPGLRHQLATAITERRSLENKLNERQVEMSNVKRQFQTRYEAMLAELFKLQSITVEAAENTRITAMSGNWEGEVKKFANVTGELVTPVEADVNKRRTDAQNANAAQVKEIIEKIADLAGKTKDARDKVSTRLNELRKQKTDMENACNAARAEIERRITREPLSVMGLPPVGRVLATAAGMNTAVINLGTRVGVKRGMRFEVYQVRYGNRRVHKGYLEVKSVEPEVSTCSILVREVRLPRCPVCSYTAAEPEELYCPRHTEPGPNPQAYQRLSNSPKVVMIGQSDTDPVVKGDLVYNPLFSLRSGMRYAIVGEPLVDRKYCDRFSVAKAVEFYGGTVDQSFTAETDVVIALALRGSEAGEAKDVVRRAEDMGVPILREFELFRYLEK